MKMILVFFLMLFSAESFAQQLNNKELSRLDAFNISLDFIDRSNELDRLSLEAFLDSDRQHRRRKRAGFIFAGAGILVTILGIVAIAKNDNDGLGGAIGDLIGAGTTAVGAVSAGVSIPFFNSAKKRKRQRDALLVKLRKETP